MLMSRNRVSGSAVPQDTVVPVLTGLVAQPILDLLPLHRQTTLSIQDFHVHWFVPSNLPMTDFSPAILPTRSRNLYSRTGSSQERMGKGLHLQGLAPWAHNLLGFHMATHRKMRRFYSEEQVTTTQDNRLATQRPFTHLGGFLSKNHIDKNKCSNLNTTYFKQYTCLKQILNVPP